MGQTWQEGDFLYGRPALMPLLEAYNSAADNTQIEIGHSDDGLAVTVSVGGARFAFSPKFARLIALGVAGLGECDIGRAHWQRLADGLRRCAALCAAAKGAP